MSQPYPDLEVVAQAQGVLMSRLGLEAIDAGVHLLNLADESGRPVVDVARELLRL